MNWLDSHNWTENIPSPVSRTDIDKFQSQLDGIVGVEPDGVLRWRVVWGQNLDQTTIWDRYQKEWRPRYPAGHSKEYIANPKTGVLELKRKWYGVPRYFIEALIPRIHRNANAERAGVDGDGDVFTERKLPEPDYITMFCITQHDIRKKDEWRACCLRRMHKGQTCFGRYRAPDQIDIDTLAEDFQIRVLSKMCRPDEIPGQRDKLFFYAAWALDHMREEKRINDELEYSQKHILSTLIHWRGSSFNSKKNRFSIPNQN